LGSFGEGQAGAELGAATRSGIDLQLSAGQRDARLDLVFHLSSSDALAFVAFRQL
jgi:hypothetical protein